MTHLTLMSPGPPSLSPVVTQGPGTNGHILEGRSEQPSGGAPTAPQGSCETWARPPALALSRDVLSPVGSVSERLRAPGWEAVLPLGHVRGAEVLSTLSHVAAVLSLSTCVSMYVSICI